MSVILGIDGGLTGALAFLVNGFEPEVIPMPVVIKSTSLFKKKKIYNLEAIKDLILKTRPNYVLLEYAQSYHKQGVVSTFTNGECFGLMKGLLFGIGLTLSIVSARAWQQVMLPPNYKNKYENTKKASIAAAKKLYPHTSLHRTQRSRIDCHGMSDALLIAEYGRLMVAVHK